MTSEIDIKKFALEITKCLIWDKEIMEGEPFCVSDPKKLYEILKESGIDHKEHEYGEFD